MFYVISGFLITRIVFLEVVAERFTYASFYERRVRRLLPALVAVLAATCALVSLFLLPTDTMAFGEALVAILLLSSNFFFWRHSGYFDGPAEGNPLLHTWSLAVEEQFYLGLPAFLLVARRWFPRRERTVVSLAAIASFALCVWQQASHPTATFYLAPFRAWQLLVGSLLGLDAVRPFGRWRIARRMFRRTRPGLFRSRRIRLDDCLPGVESCDSRAGRRAHHPRRDLE